MAPVFLFFVDFKFEKLLCMHWHWFFVFLVLLKVYIVTLLFLCNCQNILHSSYSFAMTIGLSASLGLVNEHYISRSIQFHILIWTLNKKTVPIAYYFVIRLLFLWREEVVVLPPESMEKTYCGSVLWCHHSSFCTGSYTCLGIVPINSNFILYTEG